MKGFVVGRWRPEMTIRERSISDVTVLEIGGKIAIEDGADLFRDTVQRLSSEGRFKLVVNCQGVPYVDSTALGEIVRACTTVKRDGGSLKLLNLTRRVQELLE